MKKKRKMIHDRKKHRIKERESKKEKYLLNRIEWKMKEI